MSFGQFGLIAVVFLVYFLQRLDRSLFLKKSYDIDILVKIHGVVVC